MNSPLYTLNYDSLKPMMNQNCERKEEWYSMHITTTAPYTNVDQDVTALLSGSCPVF
jgi:hypothetical protein